MASSIHAPDSEPLGSLDRVMDALGLESGPPSGDPSSLSLLWNEKLYNISELDEYTFEVESPELAGRFDPSSAPETFDGIILSNDERVEVQFRPRRVAGDHVRMGFYDLAIQGREQLGRIVRQLENPSKDEMHDLSYDDLAKGGKVEAKLASSATPTQASSLKKIMAMLVMAAAMMLIVGWVVYMVQSRSTISVSNSVMMGNYMPVNTPQQAQLTEILVKAGQQVRQGETLARLSNEEAGTDLSLLESKLQRARTEAKAYREEAKKVEATFKFTEMKVQRDLNVAMAEMQGVDANLAAARAQLTRLQPLVARGNVALAEVDEANAIVASANAEKVRQLAVIETLKFAKEAAKSKVLVTDKGATNPMSELETKISLAEAASKELEQTREILLALAKPIELLAPADGTIYAIYRNEGETVKVAEQMLAVSAGGGGWAIGHVAPYLAPEIRPGHQVEINIPSLGITTTGTVEGIGHRAVYGRGGYNADFRGGPLEVPIRVAIDLKGQQIPSGLRLHMTVRIKDHLKDMKRWINDKIATYWPETDPLFEIPTDTPASPSDPHGPVDFQVAMTH